MGVYETLTYILLQELFENGLFDIDELNNKYILSKAQVKALNKTYNELYGE